MDSEGTPSIERIKVKVSDLAAEVLPRLIGTVFHVTTAQAFDGIVNCGSISSNQDEQFEFTFLQSKNNYGRKNGYVCLFDLRDVADNHLSDALRKFYFLHPTDSDPVFLTLAPSEYGKLIPWTVAPQGAMLIPYVEAWYPHDLPTTALCGALAVTLQEDDADSYHRGVMRRLHQDKDELLDSGRVYIGAYTIAELQQRAEEWTRVAQDGGLQVVLGWQEDRVERIDVGYRIPLRAERPQPWVPDSSLSD